ncbi:uncharacterized protein LOC131326303 isoform X1 [Rhododendron vialii]|uniref:uncharacterized protein LOC131326303 isoform X1 n=1 Tax=Rhododendron vialii TaxID=182163 RepID=UPI00265D966B|nr:uncharacterized protein LOC131326303 isoform X1 [Rhododendron vialii]
MSESSIRLSSSASKRNSKRLLFDRRYGWIFDEWKDPAEEALAGGRQMFCIVPVSKAWFCMASQWINLVGSSTVEVIKRPELLSPQILQSNINNQLQKCISFIQKPEFNLFSLLTWELIASMSHPDPKTNESQTG